MAKRRFAAVGTVRLPLSEGDWIEVREELTLGELLVVRRKAATPEGLDDSLAVLAKLEAYLTDWSFRDEDGDPVPVSRQTIEALTDDTSGEVWAAIKAHEEKAADPAGNAVGEATTAA